MAAASSGSSSSSSSSSPPVTNDVIPSTSLVKEAITSIRHRFWYHDEHGGGCPKDRTKKDDSSSCKAVFSFDALPSSKQPTLKEVKVCLTKKTDICPYEKEEEEEEQDEEEEEEVNTPSKRSAAARLCELHRQQATWKNYGTSCDDFFCHGHEWPLKKDAPLLYLKSTSPRQAVILLHFGLLKETNVTRLIMDHFPVAILVAHLLHNNGHPDESAMELLDNLDEPVRSCLTSLWRAPEHHSSEEEEEESLVSAPGKFRSTPTREARKSLDPEEEETKKKKESKKGPKKRLDFDEQEEESPAPTTPVKKARKSEKKQEEEEEESKKEEKEEEEEEDVPSSSTPRKKKNGRKILEEDNSDEEKKPASPKKVRRQDSKKKAEASEEEEEEKEEEEQEEDDDEKEVVEEENKAEEEKSNEDGKETKEDKKKTNQEKKIKLPPDSKLVIDALPDDFDDNLSNLEKAIDWEEVSYRGKIRDRKKCVYSKIESNWRDFDGIEAKKSGPFPDLIEKYRLFCQKQANTELNHCVAIFFPKTSSCIGTKKEDLDQLEEDSKLYVLAIGSDCWFELERSVNVNLKFIIPRGSLCIVGQDTLKNCKIGFPLKVHSDPTLLNKPRIVLMFRSVKEK